jgi:hypothetical protein
MKKRRGGSKILRRVVMIIQHMSKDVSTGAVVFRSAPIKFKFLVCDKFP